MHDVRLVIKDRVPTARCKISPAKRLRNMATRDAEYAITIAVQTSGPRGIAGTHHHHHHHHLHSALSRKASHNGRNISPKVTCLHRKDEYPRERVNGPIQAGKDHNAAVANIWTTDQLYSHNLPPSPVRGKQTNPKDS